LLLTNAVITISALGHPLCLLIVDLSRGQSHHYRTNNGVIVVVTAASLLTALLLSWWQHMTMKVLPLP
jgi:hypothetical protein